MKVNIKKIHKDAVIPKYAKPGDAGMDLTAISVKYTEDDYLEYDTGIAMEIPEGFVGLVYPRSSISDKELFLSNSVGVIDSLYRGSIKARFKVDICSFWSPDEEDIEGFLNDGEFPYFETAENEHRGQSVIANVYKPGDRICQLIIMPYPKIEFNEVDELSKTDRSEGGYGSTGK